ncbi:NADPH-dependent FMN reductase [Oricola cellulosilytica]|uniref:NAD(P)H-dependent oxidoreductase n=1 Tax=Oricola cellulosilytica TaxID=1429082 RepID=A0A4R0P5X7_9HYPH|nr:NADPH-dependent FMN reductase [Oricola cellulosilytica]TCD12314.1 NAD(P)H-dependent oxidoreductase [Oricola cellulosilytica]
MKLKLNVIVTSTRPGRNGIKVGKWMADFASENSEFDVELVDLADYDLPLLDEPNHPAMQQYEHDHTKRWSAVNGKADAFVFVSPEYDYFPAASTVNAIQTLHREWQKKPVGLVGYGGVSGGMRAMQTTKVLMTGVNLMPLPQEVPIPFVFDFLSEDGFAPAPEVEEGAKAMLAELHDWAETLKPLREQEVKKAA